MATELAKIGLNIILIARTKSKLDTCAEEIRSKFSNIDVRCIDIDFSSFDAKQRKRVADEIKGVDVGVLVNNVGVSYPFTKYFHELTDAEVSSLVTLNGTLH